MQCSVSFFVKNYLIQNHNNRILEVWPTSGNRFEVKCIGGNLALHHKLVQIPTRVTMSRWEPGTALQTRKHSHKNVQQCPSLFDLITESQTNLSHPSFALLFECKNTFF